MTLSRLYNSNLSAALSMQSSKVNRTGLEKSRTGSKSIDMLGSDRTIAVLLPN
jgi:hypothetical protein